MPHSHSYSYSHSHPSPHLLHHIQQLALTNFPENDWNQNNVCCNCHSMCRTACSSQQRKQCHQLCAAHVCAHRNDM